MHISLEVASALLVSIPIFALARAIRQRPSARLYLALAAFAVLETRVLLLILIHTVVAVDHFVEELLDFGGDLAAISMFAAAFLYGPRWSPGGARPDTA